MRTIAHISDLHFGRVDEGLLDPLIAAIDAAHPDVIAVSGDLTQRARSRQFAAAAAFLDRLKYPKVVVPGNHDVPLFNLFARFVRPLSNYVKHITPDLDPRYQDNELLVLGVNTARSLTWKGGRINQAQLDQLRERLCSVPQEVVKVVVTHHPFDVAVDVDSDDIVGRARMAMRQLARCGVDLLLAGHLHHAHTKTTAERFAIADHAALVVQAGTATSHRTRQEANSFNVIRAEPKHAIVERYVWSDAAREFVASSTEEFRAEGEVWRQTGADAD